MYLLIAYLKFLFTSSNQHGVHSPFVYGYVTKCLYSKNKYTNTKTLNILLKSIAYFNAKNVFIHKNNENIKNSITSHFPHIHFDKNPFDVMYFDTPRDTSLDLGNIQNNTIVLINGIHHTSKNTTEWERIKNTEQVRITIDMFYCGAVFFRKEQAREHFKIRI